METLNDLFEQFAARGEKAVFVHRTGVRRITYSYAYLDNMALRMSRFLASRDVGRGDRVVVWGPNSPWWGVAFWGIIVRGAIVVPIDFMSGRERAETIAGLTGAKLVIQSRAKLERITLLPSVLLEELEFLLSSVEPSHVTLQARAGDIAQLIYTSGTTGSPKGVILTHRNLLANLEQVNQHIPVVTSSFHFLSLLPLSHMFEQMGGFFTPLYRGSTVIYLRTLKPTAIMEALSCEDIHAIIAVPRLLQLLKDSIERLLEKILGNFAGRFLALGEKLALPQRRILYFPIHRKFGRHFTLFVSGGAPLDPDLFRFWQALGFKVLEGYGLTECAPVLTANTMAEQVIGSVGMPLPRVEIKVVGGEVCARGENVFPGYYLNEKASRAAFTDDGWFRTGDLGEIGSDGHLRIKGRVKDLIVTDAGINIYPEELENILNRVKGVRESCVIGFRKLGGEIVHAVLVLDGSGRKPEAIIDEANGHLDSLHQINDWSIWPEPEFPKTTTLKIRKFIVKERIEQGRGAEEGEVSTDFLVNLVARLTGTTAAAITEESRLVADLGLTSISRLELITYLEQQYRLDLEDTLITPETTIGELHRHIARREKIVRKSHLRRWANSSPLRLIRQMTDFLFHYPLFGLFVTLERKGVEHLATFPGPVIFIANHMSYLDQPSIMFALPPRWRYNTATAAWEEFFFKNFKNIFQMLWKRFTFEYGTFTLNLFPLPQSNGFRKALQHMGWLADHCVNILVFPEGERSQDGRLLTFKPGLGIMVQELGIPVVPVCIAGVDKVLPRDGLWPHRGKVTVTFGEPLRFTTETADVIVAKSQDAILALQANNRLR